MSALDAVDALAQPAPGRRGDLDVVISAIGQRLGCWVLIEQDGDVLLHRAADGDCPAPLVTTLVGRVTAPMRRAVRWKRGSTPPHGSLDGLRVDVVEHGDGVRTWIVGASGGCSSALRAELDEAVGRALSPLFDATVDDLLHSRGPSLTGHAPRARLLLVRADNLRRAATACRAVTTGLSVRLHQVEGLLLVVLPADADGRSVHARLATGGEARAVGSAVVRDGADDWREAFRLAHAALDAAEALGLGYGEPTDPQVALQMLAREATEAIVQLSGLIGADPLGALRRADEAQGGQLQTTLLAWMTAGFDTAGAAARVGVHPNTFRYRLAKARELTGLTADNLAHAPVVQLLLRESLGTRQV